MVLIVFFINILKKVFFTISKFMIFYISISLDFYIFHGGRRYKLKMYKIDEQIVFNFLIKTKFC